MHWRHLWWSWSSSLTAYSRVHDSHSCNKAVHCPIYCAFYLKFRAPFFPHLLAKVAIGSTCLSDAAGNFLIENVGKGDYYPATWRLKHHFSLLDACCKSKALGGCGQRICKSLKVILWMGNDSAVISLQDVTNKRLSGFRLFLQALGIKDTSICPVFDLNAWIRVFTVQRSIMLKRKLKIVDARTHPFLDTIRYKELIILTPAD